MSGRGKFITFEGGEGSGKSTHAAALAEALKARGLDVVLTREPGGSPGAEIIRHIILSGIAKPLGTETETILFAAARDDHVKATILPALQAGRWVVCDRFVDSTRVYQGTLGKVDMKLIRALERVTVGEAMPDLTILLDVPANIGLARAKTRRGSGVADRFEAESVEFHEELRQAFLNIAAREPKRFAVIDGRAPRDVVSERIWQAVQERLLDVPQPAEAVTP
ncbi:thymidylate kinase [Pseudolabrys sp. Root1462]|jgi:dTMP kinase|uniref:dTMP kinase n=1 Tax=Pseudolabrys sp. Root1462 TaxID=1736466 RepID=UPI0007025CD5|nr:dTMP kinase [Pseudolabrys sp. Root1462]KQZ01060.1 thymidylate kinase [Pseudolabrys sp. Root1462]